MEKLKEQIAYEEHVLHEMQNNQAVMPLRWSFEAQKAFIAGMKQALNIITHENEY